MHVSKDKGYYCSKTCSRIKSLWVWMFCFVNKVRTSLWDVNLGNECFVIWLWEVTSAELTSGTLINQQDMHKVSTHRAKHLHDWISSSFLPWWLLSLLSVVRTVQTQKWLRPVYFFHSFLLKIHIGLFEKNTSIYNIIKLGLWNQARSWPPFSQFLC